MLCPNAGKSLLLVLGELLVDVWVRPLWKDELHGSNRVTAGYTGTDACSVDLVELVLVNTANS